MYTEFNLIDHTLRGPLNTVLVNLELLAVSDADNREHVSRMRTEILRLGNALLPAMFDIFMLELGDVREVDPRGVVEQALAEHELKGVELRPGAWPKGFADERLLRLAVAHLARNALAATPEGGRSPEVAAEMRNGGIELVVRDWGRGAGAITPNRPYPTRRGHLGGVVAVVRIARLHGGGLAFESAGDGTLARLTLPGPPR